MTKLNTTQDIENEIVATKKMALAGIIVGSMALIVSLFAIFLG
jgi:hypothetical protein